MKEAATGSMAMTFLSACMTCALFLTSAFSILAVSPAQASQPLVRMHSPVLGNPSAPVVIVEFFDPACESCREFYPVVKRIQAADPLRIALVLRYAPFHRGADQVVALLEAARKQGKLWPVLDALMASQPEWTAQHRVQIDQVWKHLGGLGLNLEQLRTDMAAPGIRAIIAQDLADASTLKVGGTPTFFVNGRALDKLGEASLRKLVQEELKKAAPATR